MKEEEGEKGEENAPLIFRFFYRKDGKRGRKREGKRKNENLPAGKMNFAMTVKRAEKPCIFEENRLFYYHIGTKMVLF